MTSELNPEGCQPIKRGTWIILQSFAVEFLKLVDIAGSFEITVTTEDGESKTVWSGVNLGPPRKLKFPDSEAFLDLVKEFLE